MCPEQQAMWAMRGAVVVPCVATTAVPYGLLWGVDWCGKQNHSKIDR